MHRPIGDAQGQAQQGVIQRGGHLAHAAAVAHAVPADIGGLLIAVGFAIGAAEGVKGKFLPGGQTRAVDSFAAQGDVISPGFRQLAARFFVIVGGKGADHIPRGRRIPGGEGTVFPRFQGQRAAFPENRQGVARLIRLRDRHKRPRRGGEARKIPTGNARFLRQAQNAHGGLTMGQGVIQRVQRHEGVKPFGLGPARLVFIADAAPFLPVFINPYQRVIGHRGQVIGVLRLHAQMKIQQGLCGVKGRFLCPGRGKGQQKQREQKQGKTTFHGQVPPCVFS